MNGPVAEIPEPMLPSYTMHGQIPVTTQVCSNNTLAEPRLRLEIETLIAKAKRRERNYYACDKHLFAALVDYPIVDKDVVVFGSQEPWYEAVCLAEGARPTTIEYNVRNYQHPGIKTYTVEDANAACLPLFDIAISISSFEHDGLGRYGDPLDPDGDLKAMDVARSRIKVGGLMFLAVPVGKDELRWNAHRVYGPVRLPVLLGSWEVMGTYGLPERPFEQERWVQPVFVLKRTC